MKKLPSLLLFLGIGYLLPLFAEPSLMLHPFIWILMAGCAVVVLTQPDTSPEELKATAETDRNSYLVIYACAVIGIIAPIVEWAYFKPLHSTWNTVSIAGLGIILGGLALRVWSIRTLGRFFTATVQLQDGHQLVKRGPYRLLRHPSYVGAYLAYIGSALLLNAYLGGVIAAAAMGVAYSYRMAAEELALRQRFGEEYAAYQRQTYRLLPWVW